MGTMAGSGNEGRNSIPEGLFLKNAVVVVFQEFGIRENSVWLPDWAQIICDKIFAYGIASGKLLRFLGDVDSIIGSNGY